jgi:competence protein ComEC
VVLAAATVVLALAGLAGRPDGNLRVSFLDVGQGDAVLIRAPNGRTVLVDGGPDGVGVQNALGRRLPFGGKRLDLIVLTHPHDDHLVGLIDVLQSHQVGQVLQGPAPPKPSAAYRRWAELVGSLNVPATEAQTGQTIDLGDGARLRVAHAGEAWNRDDSDGNDASLALVLERGAFKALLPGDGGPDVQSWLSDWGEVGGLTALKVPHHGAAGSLDDDFLFSVAPQAAVISVGRNNRFGHPSAETLSALAPAEIFRTDLHGSIELTVDGDGRYWFERSR